MTRTQIINEIVRLIGKTEYHGEKNIRLIWLVGVLIGLLAEVLYRDSLYRKIILGKLKELAKEPNKTY